jgi:hypothetical protein
MSGESRYNEHMNILRRLGLSIAVFLFSMGVSVFALFISVHFVIDTPQPLENALRTSGIYSAIVPNLITQQAKTSALPYADPGIEQALEQALPPSFLQNSSEQVVNSIYAWVHGTTAAPAFSIDLSQVKNNFASNVATYVQQKLNALPACTQLVEPPTTVADVLSMTCMPYGVSSATIANDARQEALNGGLFPQNGTIDSSVFKDSQGKPLTDKLAIVPKIHHYYILSLYLLPVVILLSAVAVIFWSVTKRAGTKRIAWILVTTGVSSIVVALVGVWLLNESVTTLGGLSASTPLAIQTKLLSIMATLAADLRIWWIGIGAGYAVAGIILLVVVKLNKPKQTLSMGDTKSYKQPPSISSDYNPNLLREAQSPTLPGRPDIR